MSIDWTEARIYKLVLSYIRQECLWKRGSNDCYDLEARNNAYLNIIRDVNVKCLTVAEVRDKIRQIRRIYRSELTKINDANLRGFPYKPNITWFELMHAFLCAYLTDDEDTKVENSSHTDAEKEKYSNDRCNIPLELLPRFQRRYDIEGRPNNIGYFPNQSNRLDTFPKKLTMKNKQSTVTVQKSCNNIGSELISTAGDYSTIKNYGNDRDVIVKPLLTLTNSGKKFNKLRKKYGDEFDVFGKSVACQLRELSLPHALRTQIKIQSLLAEERINSNQDKEITNGNAQRRKKNSQRQKNLHWDSPAMQSSKSSHSSSINYRSNFQCPSAGDFSSSGVPSNRSRQNNHERMNKTDKFHSNNSELRAE